MPQPLPLRALKGTALTIQEADEQHALQYVQPGHGLVVGDLVYPTSGTAVAKARADAAATVAAGVVVGVAGDTLYVAYAPGVVVTKASHGLGATGTTAWLSQSTAGTSGAKPATGIQQPVFHVISSSLLLWVGLPTLYTEI